MLRSFKTEINPTDEQKNKINRTTGTCRYVYNLFLGVNNVRHRQGKPYLDGYAFSRWLNNEYLAAHPEKNWIKEVSSKAVKQSVMNADGAFKKFFKGESSYPSYKKKNRSDVKMYFVKNNSTDCISERHRIKIPHARMGEAERERLYPCGERRIHYPQRHSIKEGRQVLCILPRGSA